jgi:hypothetical protein
MTLIVEVEVAFPPSEADVVGPLRLNSTGVAAAFSWSSPFAGGVARVDAFAHGSVSEASRASELTLSASSSSSSSLIMPLGIAIGFPMWSRRSASTQKASNFENPGASENVATFVPLPRGIVRWRRPPSQSNVHVLPSVRSLHLSRSLRLVAWVCAQCCGLRSRTLPSGTRYEFGIKNSVITPWSSSHFHRNVPTFTLVTRFPPNPLNARFLGRIECGTKSPMSCDKRLCIGCRRPRS